VVGEVVQDLVVSQSDSRARMEDVLELGHCDPVEVEVHVFFVSGDFLPVSLQAVFGNDWAVEIVLEFESGVFVCVLQFEFHY
jgi:hypothetical protein